MEIKLLGVDFPKETKIIGYRVKDVIIFIIYDKIIN